MKLRDSVDHIHQKEVTMLRRTQTHIGSAFLFVATFGATSSGKTLIVGQPGTPCRRRYGLGGILGIVLLVCGLAGAGTTHLMAATTASRARGHKLLRALCLRGPGSRHVHESPWVST